MQKTAIVVFSDPAHGGDEALGRVVNALFLALALQEKGQQVALVFQGAGARWPAELMKAAHPGHAAYAAVRPAIAGICGACADVFGATADAAETGLPLVREKEIAGVGRILDLSRYLDDGYRLIAF